MIIENLAIGSIVILLIIILISFRFSQRKNREAEKAQENDRKKRHDVLLSLREYVDKGEVKVKHIMENDTIMEEKIKDMTLTKKGNFHLYTEEINIKTVTLPKTKTKRKPKKEV